MAHTPLDQHILDLLDQNGEMRSRDIYATKPEISINTIKGRKGKTRSSNSHSYTLTAIY